MQINFGTREVSCKIVYYGPGLCGKTTNLRIVHKKAPEGHCGSLTSIATDGDRTLFFDFLPIELGSVSGMRTKFQLYTVPGQVYYNATRKLVLAGADGVVFVADSQKRKMKENKESLANLEENLREHGADIREIPIIFQYNKRDLEDIESVEVMEKELNWLKAPSFESVAIKGEGVFPTLRACLKRVIASLEKQDLSEGREMEETPAARKAGAAVGKTPAPQPVPPKEPEGGKTAVAIAPQGTEKTDVHATKAEPVGRKDPRVQRPAPAKVPQSGPVHVSARVPGTGAKRPPVYIGGAKRAVPGWGIVLIIAAVAAVIGAVLLKLGVVPF